MFSKVRYTLPAFQAALSHLRDRTISSTYLLIRSSPLRLPIACSLLYFSPLRDSSVACGGKTPDASPVGDAARSLLKSRGTTGGTPLRVTLLRTLVPRYRFANATATLTPVAYGGKPAYSAGFTATHWLPSRSADLLIVNFDSLYTFSFSNELGTGLSVMQYSVTVRTQ